MSRSAPPILVTGCHRSGSTWVGKLLAASPGVGYISEPFNRHYRPGVFAKRLPRWFTYVCEENAAEYEQAVRDMLNWRCHPLHGLASVRSPRDLARLVRDCGVVWGRRLRGARPLMKDPIAVFSAPWLHRTFGMDVVVLIRHPAAFAASLKARLGQWGRHRFAHFLEQPLLMRDLLHPFEAEIRRAAEGSPDILDEAILLWKLIYYAVLRFQERYPEWIYVRHEDLSREPETEFRRLFQRLGLPYTRRARQGVASTSSPANPQRGGAGHSVYRDSRSVIWNWKKSLSAAEVARIREATARLAEAFYAPEDW